MEVSGCHAQGRWRRWRRSCSLKTMILLLIILLPHDYLYSFKDQWSGGVAGQRGNHNTKGVPRGSLHIIEFSRRIVGKAR